jgi:hypothetical protein
VEGREEHARCGRDEPEVGVACALWLPPRYRGRLQGRRCAPAGHTLAGPPTAPPTSTANPTLAQAKCPCMATMLDLVLPSVNERFGRGAASNMAGLRGGSDVRRLLRVDYWVNPPAATLDA